MDPVTEGLGGLSVVFMSCSFTSSVGLLLAADSWWRCVEPVVLLGILFAFWGRLFTMRRSANGLMFSVKKRDDAGTTFLPAISSESFGNGAVSV